MTRRHGHLTIGLVAAGLLALPATGAARAGDGPLVVDDDGADCPRAAYRTIGEAVAAAATTPGRQVIQVCAGTYAEDVLIEPGNSVELRGAGRDRTILTGAPGTAGPIIEAAGAGKVAVLDLAVDGRSAMAGPVAVGILFDGTSGTVRDVTVRNIRDASGRVEGLGVRFEAGPEATNNAVIGSRFENITRVAVVANGEGVRAIIQDNEVVGPSDKGPRAWAANGIQVSRGARAQVTGNRLRGATSPTPSRGVASGILLYCAGPSEVGNNTVVGSDLGVSVADTQGARVERNDVEEARFAAFSVEQVGGVFGDLGCPLHPTPTQANELSGNQARGSAGEGIAVRSFDGSVEGALKGNVFARNRVRGSASTDVVDPTEGDGTAGTGNTWSRNDCTTSAGAPCEPAAK